MHYGQLRDEARDAAVAVADLLRTAPDGDQHVPGLEWTIADVGGHLVTVARRSMDVARGEPFSWDPGDDTHASMAAFNDSELVELGERDPVKLAGLLEDDGDALLEAYGRDGERIVRWPTDERRVQDSVGLWLGELLIHGLDIARALGRAWPIRREQAAAVIDGLVPVLPAFANREEARAAVGTYHVHVRGGGDYTIRASPDGTVTAERGEPGRADLHISANPVAYLLVGYGRVSHWTAIAKGQIAARGRKPWLALKFADLFHRP